MNAAVSANSVASVDLEYVCSYWATLASLEVVGPVAEGIRADFYVTLRRNLPTATRKRVACQFLFPRRRPQKVDFV
jgi:hypothetical protein